jgi:hypothetical protein
MPNRGDPEPVLVPRGHRGVIRPPLPRSGGKRWGPPGPPPGE